MALPDLAVLTDLQARGVDTDSSAARTTLAETMLAVASAVVREAAGSPILEVESTLSLNAWGGNWLELPGQPVQSVSAVTFDGTLLDADDYALDGGSLWRTSGWGCSAEPTPVAVTMLHGLPEVPEDIVNLVCDLAIAGMNAAPDGARDSRVIAERIDDYSVQFAQGAEQVASIMELPRATRLRLRSRFGGGAVAVSHR